MLSDDVLQKAVEEFCSVFDRLVGVGVELWKGTGSDRDKTAMLRCDEPWKACRTAR